MTRLGLGTAPLGNLFRAVEEREALATVARAYELGLRLFDTAPVYGYGEAERRLGQALASCPADVVVATKVGRLLRSGAPADLTQWQAGEPIYKATPPVNPVFDFSYDGVLRSLGESLTRLGRDRVDVVHIHDPDEHYDEALRGAYPALARLRADGAVGAVSVGMSQSAMLARFARDADFDCFLLAGRYTLLDQSGLSELLPLCAERGIGIIAGGVYNSGILADPRPGATYDYAPAGARRLAQARRLAEVCRRHDVPLGAAAIQFPYGHPAVAAVVVGARSPAELEEDVAMLQLPLPPDLWAELRAEGLLGEEVPVPRARQPAPRG
ncbi:MAG: aldo/keto reductase [Acidimicrobiales bacterium]